ncbi:MAG: aminoglycoside phosphotransferase family protein [Abditibacteriota bacterium]|nr:aminoglycoside phosphotransferase family protein [Abditibacteriota bacterium]
MMDKQMEEVLGAWGLAEICTQCYPFGNGHINDTYCVECVTDKYVLQRINHLVFTRPDQVMDNISRVTAHIRAKGQLTLNVVPTTDDKPYYKDSKGCWWRVYDFIKGAVTYELIKDSNMMYEAGKAIGDFSRLLSDFPIGTLYETIPHFHDTPARFKALKAAIKADKFGRLKACKKEIDFMMDREHEVSFMTDLQKKGEIPTRVTINDTKINNVMFDEAGRAACVIDLDTVMPGIIGNDFGDAVRIGCCMAEEDEKDLSKVVFNMDYYDSFSRGFLESCGGSLNAMEKATLAMAAKLRTFEDGIRFMTDHLSGDVYFKIHRENHNLDRCRTQLKMVEQMEELLDARKSAFTPKRIKSIKEAE